MAKEKARAALEEAKVEHQKASTVEVASKLQPSALFTLPQEVLDANPDVGKMFADPVFAKALSLVSSLWKEQNAPPQQRGGDSGEKDGRQASGAGDPPGSQASQRGSDDAETATGDEPDVDMFTEQLAKELAAAAGDRKRVADLLRGEGFKRVRPGPYQGRPAGSSAGSKSKDDGVVE